MLTPVTATFPPAIDNSILDQFKICDQRGVYGFFENLSPTGTSVHLHAGGAFAYGMEKVRRAYYQHGATQEAAISCGINGLLKYYGDYDPPEGSAKTAERMAGALDFYFERYPLDKDYLQPWNDGTNFGIEFNFAIPLPLLNPETGEPLIYTGRFDMLAIYNKQALFIDDEKTTTSLGAQWSKQWELDSQFTGYVWGARQYGFDVQGAIIRGVSILKTKYDTAQAIIYRPQWQLDRWYAQMLMKVEHMIRLWKREVEPELKLSKSACGSYGGCAYLPLCTSPQPDRWKPVNFEPRVWHPLIHEDRLTEISKEA